MIHWAIRRAKHLNKAFVRLDCAADRPKLCQFYESQGFKKVSEKVLFGKYPTAFYEFEISQSVVAQVVGTRCNELQNP
jgi:hypothetical protein